MAYAKQHFVDGEVLTASQLNHMEEGIENASHLPIIGENGNWWEWDGTAYVDTGRPSKGEDAAAHMVAEVVGETLCLYPESGAPIHAEVKNDTLCIG